jgi:hypothetical protein
MSKLGQEPAFPSNEEVWDGYELQRRNYKVGMNRRFYAACFAMQGLISGMPSDNAAIWKKQVIERAYTLADELLKQEYE